MVYFLNLFESGDKIMVEPLSDGTTTEADLPDGYGAHGSLHIPNWYHGLSVGLVLAARDLGASFVVGDAGTCSVAQFVEDGLAELARDSVG